MTILIKILKAFELPSRTFLGARGIAARHRSFQGLDRVHMTAGALEAPRNAIASLGNGESHTHTALTEHRLREIEGEKR